MVEALVYAYFYLVLYSFLGWICESTYVSIPKGHFVNRGSFMALIFLFMVLAH